ncbi:hypothetical protein [Nannocystis punicea]|uniref:Uncharacterized protein n=1 Tax=Nannocystis punicea TaxID=2995304 RepID=A0ABY7HIB1_9BACT|nr:hypothetical protein [Nannocystis poenicansa]WAS98838.1 hypothetical protein O0S08_22130 [Nannocystis poenicansa]
MKPGDLACRPALRGRNRDLELQARTSPSYPANWSSLQARTSPSYPANWSFFAVDEDRDGGMARAARHSSEPGSGELLLALVHCEIRDAWRRVQGGGVVEGHARVVPFAISAAAFDPAGGEVLRAGATERGHLAARTRGPTARELAGDIGDDQGELADELAAVLRADQPDVSNVRASALS